ncbi:MAG TPA: carboxypeptidase regulatory-like domain-containing protein [Pyrinomonadaceae bacterium]|nr:carboxypeptidase regulatory-like domain-containing protein [Pyrinomonadaceae bacterium]
MRHTAPNARRLLSIFLAALILFPNLLFAPQASAASLQQEQIRLYGYVKDQFGQPVSGALVTISGAAAGGTTTDANGYYQFSLFHGGCGPFEIKAFHNVVNGAQMGSTVSVSGCFFSDYAVPDIIYQAPYNVTLDGYVKNSSGAGVPGVTVNLTGDSTQTTATDANGHYAFSVPAGCVSLYEVNIVRLDGVTGGAQSTSGCITTNYTLSDFLYNPPLPTNGKIVFNKWGAVNSSPADGVYLINADGTGETKIPGSEGDYAPVWSPDGTRIAVTRPANQHSGNVSGSGVEIFKPDGTGRVRLNDNAEPTERVAWSPDGQKIAYTSWGQFGADADIMVMNVDGSNVVNLTNTPGYDYLPTWSPDGQKIAFATTRNGNANLEIYVMNADGSDQHNITNFHSHDYYPSWSPDGSKIAFFSMNRGQLFNQSGIFVMNADGSNVTFVNANAPAGGLMPAWSPDGTKVIYSSDRDGNRDLYYANADGSGETRVTTAPTQDSRASWQPLGVPPMPFPTPTPTPTVSADMQVTSEAQPNVVEPGGSLVFRSRVFNNGPSMAADVTFSETIPPGLTLTSIQPTIGMCTSVTLSTGSPISCNLGNMPAFTEAYVTVYATVNLPDGAGAQVHAQVSSSSPDASTANNTSDVSFIVRAATPTPTPTPSPTPTPTPTPNPTPSPTPQPTPTPTTTPTTTPTPAPGPNGKIVFTRFANGNVDIFSMNSDGTGVTRLTTDAALDFDPAWSPDGHRILFVSNRGADGKSRIYSMFADGSNVSVVVNVGGVYFSPAWSPDGSKVAFSGNGDGSFQLGGQRIWVANSDGTGTMTRLTDGSTGQDYNPTWLPGGTQIGFRRFYNTGNNDIFVMNADGSNQSNLTNTSSAAEYDPKWSPDGTRIAFRTTEQFGRHAVFVMNADGTNRTQLTTFGQSNNLAPDWSPDGSKLAFTSERDNNQEIYVMNADGTGQTRITNDPAGDGAADWQRTPTTPPPTPTPTPTPTPQPTPTPTPTATPLRVNGQIAFEGGGNGSAFDISVVNPDGTGRALLLSESNHEQHPAWSPDGKKIAFTHVKRGTYEVFTANADGTNRQRISDGYDRSPRTSDYYPAWSPDGTRLVFARNNQLWTVDSGGGQTVKLSNGTDDDQQPSWSPDGSKIAFVRNWASHNAQIFVMNADGTNQINLSNNFNVSNRRPAWSPDGSKIAFQRGQTIWLMNADGSNQTMITQPVFSEPSDHPVWSPDGTQIAFIGTRNNVSGLYVMNPDGTNQRLITAGAAHPTWRALPALSLSLDAAPDPVINGGQLTYTITLRNNHTTETATGVSLIDETPIGATIADVTASQGACSAPVNGQAGVVNCALGDLAAGTEATVTIVVNVMQGGTVIQNTATADASFAGVPYTVAETVESGVSQETADLAVFNYGPYSPVEPGWSAGYSIYVYNNGPNRARDVSFTDVLPQGFALNYFYNELGTCTTPANGETGTITCSFGDIEPNTGVSIYVQGTVTAAPGATLENTASVTTTTADPQSANNTMTVQTPVVAPPPPPANDNFANAQEITGATGTVAGSNLFSTKETGEPNHAGQHGGSSIWYRWQAPASGYVEFTTEGSDHGDPLLGVYTGAGVASLTEVASNNDLSLFNFASRVRFEAVAGTVYYIALDGQWGQQAPLTLTWTQPVAAPTPQPNPPTTGTIVFTRQPPNTNTTDIYSMKADGSNQTNLTSTPDQWEDEGRWSPDGTRIAFVSEHTDGAVELAVMNGDGTNRQTLAGGMEWMFYPEWSPDSTKVVFNAYNGAGSDIYVVNADGTGLTKLTTSIENDTRPLWSPDGSKITFLSHNSDYTQQVYVMNADGTGRQRLTEEQHTVSTARWIPGTSRIAYAAHPGLRSVNADGTDSQLLLGDDNEFVHDFGWSRDGSRVTYYSYADGIPRYYTANADGSNRVQLTEGIQWGSNPQFSPDGAVVTYDTHLKSPGQVYALWSDGATQQLVSLTNNPEGGYSHHWRPVMPAGDTPNGTNVTVTESGATLTFSNVTQAGETTVTPIDPNSLQGIPGEYIINANSLAFEITTTAVYTGPITIGFQVPGITNPITFSTLRVLHGEPPAPNFVDRTILAPDSPSHNFTTRTVYARVPSLSPFIITELSGQDTTPPAINVAAPAVDAVYLLGQNVAASYGCRDFGSGVAECTGTIANGAPLNTGAVGAFSFTVNARDNAGNTGTRTVNYRVAYSVNALFDQTKAHKSGSVVPIKLELRNAANANQSSSGIVVTALSVVRISDNAPGALADPGDSNPDYNFRYTGGAYHFNLKTGGYATGTYLLSFKAGNDPVTHTVQFQVK